MEREALTLDRLAAESRLDLGTAVEVFQQQCGGLERRQRLAARLATNSPVAGPVLRVQHEPSQLRSHGLRHHKVFASFQLPSSSTTPPTPRSIAC
jgi:hypothetical protein